MATIETTVTTTLQQLGLSQYVSYAARMTRALQDRERQISSALIDYAVDAGADADDIRAYLDELGMEVDEERPASPISAVPDADLPALRQQMAQMARQLEVLTEFATRHGLR
jgi:hypothetical protein